MDEPGLSGARNSKRLLVTHKVGKKEGALAPLQLGGANLLIDANEKPLCRLYLLPEGVV